MKPEDAVFTICPNRAGCPGQSFQHVKHFVSKGAMDIDGLGEKQALRFLEEGLIADVADIYDLDEEQLVGAGGLRRDLGPQPASRRSTPRAQRALPARPLRARPARGRLRHRRGAGRRTSARSTPCSDADPEQIEEVEGVGPIMAVQIAESLADERTWELVEKLREKGLRLELDASERRRARAARWRARRSSSPAPCRS